jgi:hypothetical protein
MTCNSCETTFQGSQSLVISVGASVTSAYLDVSNQGRNIVLIRRILLCASFAGGNFVLYLRPPPDPISWIYPSAYLEPGTGASFYVWHGLPVGSVVQAQAEYVEIDGRSSSCRATLGVLE